MSEHSVCFGLQMYSFYWAAWSSAGSLVCVCTTTQKFQCRSNTPQREHRSGTQHFLFSQTVLRIFIPREMFNRWNLQETRRLMRKLTKDGTNKTISRLWTSLPEWCRQHSHFRETFPTIHHCLATLWHFTLTLYTQYSNIHTVPLTTCKFFEQMYETIFGERSFSIHLRDGIITYFIAYRA